MVRSLEYLTDKIQKHSNPEYNTMTDYHQNLLEVTHDMSVLKKLGLHLEFQIWFHCAVARMLHNRLHCKMTGIVSTYLTHPFQSIIKCHTALFSKLSSYVRLKMLSLRLNGTSFCDV